MKARTLPILLLIAAPTLSLAGDPPSETARAERQRTIEKRKARKAQAKASRNDEARRQAEAARAGTPGLLQAAASNKAARTASLNQASAAANAPLVSVPRNNAFLANAYGANSIYNPYNPDPYAQLYGLQSYGVTNLFGVPVGTIPGQGGLTVNAPGLGAPPGVSAPPHHSGPVNPVGVNK